MEMTFSGCSAKPDDYLKKEKRVPQVKSATCAEPEWRKCVLDKELNDQTRVVKQDIYKIWLQLWSWSEGKATGDPCDYCVGLHLSQKQSEATGDFHQGSGRN